MTETEHQRTQREARERKRSARDAREVAHAASLRRTETFNIYKADLLAMLDAEGISPSGATKIIATGHHPDRLVVTVAFD